jgi:hypothetical protein
MDDTKRLDMIGEAVIEMPAAYSRGGLIRPGRKLDLYDKIDGYLGRFLYKSRSITDSHGIATLSVNLWDDLKELARHTVKFRRTYTYEPVADVIDDLVGLVGSWSATSDSGIGNTTISYEGESVLAAIDALRDRWGMHFRLEGLRMFYFGAMGDHSGVRVTNVRSAVQSEIELFEYIAFVENISFVDEDDTIYNRIYPVGAGQGTSQLTIQHATIGSYTTQTGTNKDGSLNYYIEDSDSIDEYDLRERILSLPNIRPITNSDANIINAANALKAAAEAYIARHLAPRVVYDVEVRGLRQAILPGDKIRLTYQGTVEDYSYIDVDEDFFVMDITRKRDSNGQRSARLTIASVADRRTSDDDMMVEVVSDLKALKVHVPSTLTYSPVGPYTRRIDSSQPAEFTIRIGDEVTVLNHAKVRFRTGHLKSSLKQLASASSVSTTSDSSSETTTAAGGGTSTTTAGGGGTSTTTAAGGSISKTSDSDSHDHGVPVYGGSHSVSYNVEFNPDDNRFILPTVGSGSDYASTTVSDSHAHSFSLPNHSHSFGLNDHIHSFSLTDHSHNMEHYHSFTIPAHSHSVIYGLYEDSRYPHSVYLYINSTDRTAELGGPWATTEEEVEHVVDITEYLQGSVGVSRTNHRIEFRCLDGQGEIECEGDLLLTIQAIAMS